MWASASAHGLAEWLVGGPKLVLPCQQFHERLVLLEDLLVLFHPLYLKDLFHLVFLVLLEGLLGLVHLQHRVDP